MAYISVKVGANKKVMDINTNNIAYIEAEENGCAMIHTCGGRGNKLYVHTSKSQLMRMIREAEKGSSGTKGSTQMNNPPKTDKELRKKWGKSSDKDNKKPLPG